MVLPTISFNCPYCGHHFSDATEALRLQHINDCKNNAENKAVRDYKPEDHPWRDQPRDNS